MLLLSLSITVSIMCTCLSFFMSMNQGKLEVVKQETARENVDILAISELRSLRRNGVAIMVNKRVQNAELSCDLKNDRGISVFFQVKPINIMVIQVYDLSSNAEEAKVEWFYDDLQELLELTPQKRCPFHYRGLEYKSRKSRNTWSNRQI